MHSVRWPTQDLKDRYYGACAALLRARCDSEADRQRVKQHPILAAPYNKVGPSAESPPPGRTSSVANRVPPLLVGHPPGPGTPNHTSKISFGKFWLSAAPKAPHLGTRPPQHGKLRCCACRSMFLCVVECLCVQGGRKEESGLGWILRHGRPHPWGLLGVAPLRDQVYSLRGMGV